MFRAIFSVTAIAATVGLMVYVERNTRIKYCKKY